MRHLTLVVEVVVESSVAFAHFAVITSSRFAKEHPPSHHLFALVESVVHQLQQVCSTEISMNLPTSPTSSVTIPWVHTSRPPVCIPRCNPTPDLQGFGQRKIKTFSPALFRCSPSSLQPTTANLIQLKYTNGNCQRKRANFKFKMLSSYTITGV